MLKILRSTKQDLITSLCVRFALPLTVPEYTGSPQLLQSVGKAKTWQVDTSTVFLHPEYLHPPSQFNSYKFEFAAVNPKYQGRKYTTAYGIGFGDGVLVGQSIVKLDLENKQFTRKWQDDICYTSEPIFVPRPGSNDEDDGVIITTCLSPEKNKPWSSLVVLNTDLNEVGRLTFNNVLSPASFHGAWIQGQ